MNTDIKYKTKDLGEASALICNSMKLLGLEDGGGFYWFIFEGKNKCEALSKQYWFGTLQVNARLFQEAARALKDRLFARR